MSLQQQQQDNNSTNNLSRTLQQSLQEVLMEVSLDGNLLMGGNSAPPPAPVLNPLLQQNRRQSMPQNVSVSLPQNLNLTALNIPGLSAPSNNNRASFTMTSNTPSTVNVNPLAAALKGATAVAGGTNNTTTPPNFLSQQPQTNPNALAAALQQATGATTTTGAPTTSNQPQMRPSEALGMSTEELLLAAATEKRMLEQTQQRMVARQQALAEKTLESRRLYQESLLALMKGTVASVPPPAATPTVNNNPTSLVSVANPNGLLQQGLLQQFKAPPQLQIPPVGVAAAAVPASLAESQSKTAIKVLGTSLRKKDSPYLDVSGLQDPDVSDKRTRGGVTEPFPEKLHRMLEEVKKDGKEDVISFFSHGRAFAVHDPDRFTSEVMPKYFKQSRLSSFQRQLNLYGFTRITSGPDAGGYYHELFLAGRPNLAVHMRRVGLPQGEDRRKMRAKNMRSEPNFYAMGNVKDAKVNIPGLN